MAGQQPSSGDTPRRSLVFFEPGQSFSNLEDDIRNTFGVQAVYAHDSLKENDLPMIFAHQALILEKLNVGVFSLPREVLEQKYRAANVMDDVSYFLPTTRSGPASALTGASCFPSEATNSWGRQAVNATNQILTGKSVKVCVIDSGLDSSHNDFRNRPSIVTRGFTASGSSHDFSGHGTHCAGIIFGPATPQSGMPRYGLAPDVELFVANIFGAGAEALTSLIFPAVEWAIASGCRVVSMSLQRQVDANADPQLLLALNQFELLAQRALLNEVLLVACTGNGSDRKNQRIAGAAFPGRCASVLAVGGVDRCLGIMNDSNSGADILGPGDDILSASVANGGTERMSGTSLAAAYVSGVAALQSEGTGHVGTALLNHLKNGSGMQITPSQHEPAVRLVSAT